MRSRWVWLLVGNNADGSVGTGKPKSDRLVPSKTIKDGTRISYPPAAAVRPRLCLGIGDGSVHRQ